MRRRRELEAEEAAKRAEAEFKVCGAESWDCVGRMPRTVYSQRTGGPCSSPASPFLRSLGNPLPCGCGCPRLGPCGGVSPTASTSPTCR